MNAADRKKLLIAQGAVYRAEVLHDVRTARAALRPNSLVHRAFGKLAPVALSFFGRKGGAGLAGAGASALLPLLPRVAALLARKKSPSKPLLRGTLIVGVAIAVGVAAWVVKVKVSDGSNHQDR